MRLTKGFVLTFACALLAPSAVAAMSPELTDLAGRVHYGFYHGDARAIEAAQAALERQGDSAEARYYRDFAALRRAQLGSLDRDAAKRLEACADRDVDPELDHVMGAEAWALVAACAFVAEDGRRVVEALEYARASDDDQPRIALVEAWRVQREAGTAAAESAEVGAALEAAVAAFDAWSPSIDDPDWGYAEALVALGEYALGRGETRASRDLMERALLIAPDYSLAVELRAKLQDGRGNRTP
jgi:tetratricopeptide (TPR) repeat protein